MAFYLTRYLRFIYLVPYLRCGMFVWFISFHPPVQNTFGALISFHPLCGGTLAGRSASNTRIPLFSVKPMCTSIASSVLLCGKKMSEIHFIPTGFSKISIPSIRLHGLFPECICGFGIHNKSIFFLDKDGRFYSHKTFKIPNKMGLV